MIRSKKTKPVLTNSSYEERFLVCDGQSLSNLKDLRDALVKINDDVFVYHCNKNKNDFADWIKYSLKDADLAKSVNKIKNRKNFILKIENRIKEFSC